MPITSADIGKPLSDIPGLNLDDLPVGTFVGPVSWPAIPLVKWVDNLWYSPGGWCAQNLCPEHYKLLSVPTTSVGYPVSRLRENIEMVREMLGMPESSPAFRGEDIKDAKELESILAHLLSLTRSRLIEAEKVRTAPVIQQSITRDLEPLRKCVARLHDLAGIRGEVLMDSRDHLERMLPYVVGVLEIQAMSRARDSQPPEAPPAPTLADVPMDTLLQEVAKRLKAAAPFVDHTLVKNALGLG